jgi:hypothetical protein
MHAHIHTYIAHTHTIFTCVRTCSTDMHNGASDASLRTCTHTVYIYTRTQSSPVRAHAQPTCRTKRATPYTHTHTHTYIHYNTHKHTNTIFTCVRTCSTNVQDEASNAFLHTHTHTLTHTYTSRPPTLPRNPHLCAHMLNQRAG